MTIYFCKMQTKRPRPDKLSHKTSLISQLLKETTLKLSYFFYVYNSKTILN